MKPFCAMVARIACGAIAMTLCGCLNPISARTAARYYEQGQNAEHRSNWPLAQQNYERAYINADMSFFGARRAGAKAYCRYQWSRVTGYLGETKEAELGFLETIDLISKAHGEANNLKPSVYTELARLYQDTVQYEKAARMFKVAIEDIAPRRPETVDAGAFSDLLEDYLSVLLQLGIADEAERVRGRLAVWKNEHPEPAKYKPRRYPKGQ